MGGLFTPRGAADTLTRTTAILAFLFFATCIGLNLLALHGRNETSILDSVQAPVPARTAPSACAAADRSVSAEATVSLGSPAFFARSVSG